MSTSGFYKEWISVGNNRIILECRDSFPASEERFIADVSAKVVENNASKSARVVSVYYDDKSCIHCVTVASTNEEDSAIESVLTSVLQGIFNNGNCQVNFELVKRGNESSDHYNHMEHLSVSTEFAKR
ncbi:hypothetical protein [Ferrovum myxofaciens]|uniref:hypothetical protein n=1 Tax=Ferrovum myxofaciens TaxID=416213 RepID=UPI002356FE5A|nr:hypothetical protein [Ferrovum myxofaciens]MBU6993503.1 hypothetical protein [Ferrovum myxofaciens]